VEPPFGIRHFGSGLDRTHWTEDEEISDSDDDDLPSFGQILAVQSGWLISPATTMTMVRATTMVLPR